MRELTHRETQLVVLDNLVRFSEFCKQHDLRFYLYMGTLLGAVRHKGFIPWDDDVDLCMPRPDFERMKELFPADGLDERFYIAYAGHGFDWPHARIYDHETKAELNVATEQEESQLWIDIYPVDGLPDDALELRKFYRKERQLSQELAIKHSQNWKGAHVVSAALRTAIAKPLLQLKSNQKLTSELDELARSYDYASSKHVGVIGLGAGVGTRMLKSEFEQSCDLHFEGHVFPGFACWDASLRGIYGGYMDYPETREREPHFAQAWINPKVQIGLISSAQ